MSLKDVKCIGTIIGVVICVLSTVITASLAYGEDKTEVTKLNIQVMNLKEELCDLKNINKTTILILRSQDVMKNDITHLKNDVLSIRTIIEKIEDN